MSSTEQAPVITSWDENRSTAISKCVIPLSFDSHKGSSGRVGVLGGSAHYTGAPYYAAMASLKAGADLAYVFCAKEAAIPIKSYSPELMVKPVYSATQFDEITKSQGDSIMTHSEQDKENLISSMVEEVTAMMNRMHVLVIGCGLGRCPLVLEATARIIQEAKKQNLALVLDADALWMLSLPQFQSLLQDYSKGVLTPNVVEDKRLDHSKLLGTTVIRKGKNDIISCNTKDGLLTCCEPGGMKRSGGIGDILAGTVGTLVAWNEILIARGTATPEDLPLACWTACCFVKRSTKRAFEKKKRAMTAPDILQELGSTMDEMIDEK